MNAGVCRGGPLDGQMASCDKPAGFFHVEEGRFWLYAWIQGVFFCRTPANGDPYVEWKVWRHAGDRFAIKEVAA